MTLDEYLKQVSERADKAIDGPWKEIRTPVDIERVLICTNDYEEICRIHGTTDNSEFIANARQDIPKLLQIISVMREALLNNRMQFADLMSRVKAPESWMISDIDEALLKAEEICR